MRLGLGRNLSIPRRAGEVTQGAHFFNGTTTYIQLLNTMTLQDFTIGFWVKHNYTADGRIIDFRDSAGDGVSIFNNSSTTIRAQYNAAALNSSSLTAGTWYHIAFNVSTGTDIMTCVINGNSSGTVSVAGTDIATTTAGRIGARGFSSALEFFKGNLAQMFIYNAQILNSQIVSIMGKTYNQLTAGEKAGLVSWWSLTNIVGTSVPDLHGTNTGTLTP